MLFVPSKQLQIKNTILLFFILPAFPTGWNKKKSSESNPLRSSGGGNTICVEGCVPVQISVVPEEKKNMAVGSPAIIRGKVLDHERGESSKIDKNSELKN